MIEICAVGGYNFIGKNMTALRYKDEVILLDMGIYLDKYVAFTEGEFDDLSTVSPHDLQKAGAIPDDRVISDWRRQVKAIVPTHGHLDHVGAIVFLSNKYDAPIICTPFTKEIIMAISRDEKIKLKNEVKELTSNHSYKISEKITIEFINVTHSIPQTVMVAVHTPEGTVLYANDFKFDNHPTIGRMPNYERLQELGKEGVKVLISDSTRAPNNSKTPSEMVAKEMLRDVMLGVESRGKAVIVTTFASHLARLKSIIEMGQKMGRKIVFLGRSLAKYAQAGENIGLVHFSKEAEIVGFAKKIKKTLNKIKGNLDKYLLVVTGHQGEPTSTLAKMANGAIEFPFRPEDHVIFSCNVIPTETNITNRNALEEKLHQHRVRIFKDIHVSGHASKEDLRDLINMVKPKHIVPAHGDDVKERRCI
ncbi:RNase J family beta-CASP ribonuclease [Candidatus Woesearchaeota archaeon]|nr:RNase J family beta-CASP ribonuclease [Candidatus Woesearchaeota archaeon]